MRNAGRRSVLNAVLIGFALVLITALDFAIPGNYLLVSLYAFPLLIAAFTVGPRGTAMAAVATLVLIVIHDRISQPPLSVCLLGILGACGIGGLAFQLSRQQQRVVRRSAERETARRQVTEILESIGDGFFALDHADRFTYVNQHAERVLGLDRQTIIGEPAWEQFTAETRAPFEQAAEECASRREPVHAESFDRTHGRWYEIHAYPSAAGLSIYFSDSTTRKRAEEGWRQAEAKYRSLVEQIPAITYRVEKRLGDDSNETIAEYISPQLEAMLGYQVDDWLMNPSNWAEHLHPEDRERVLEANDRANRTGKPLQVEYRLIAADGESVWVRDQATVVGVGDPDHSVWQGIIFNISAEKKTEAERAESARKFAYLAETTRMLTSTQLDYRATLKQIADLAVPQLADWSIVYLVEGNVIRRGALSFSTHEDALVAAQLEARPIMALTQQQIRDALERESVLYLPAHEQVREISDLITEDDARLINDMHMGSAIILPVRARGNLLGALLLARRQGAPDYTPEDVGFIEEVVQRFALVLDNARLYQDARLALAAREEFLSVAAHELRTPLTGIKGYVQLLERRLNKGPQSMSTVRQTLDNLRPQLARFERIVDDLLEVTRIEQNQLSMHKQPCDLSEIASQVFNALLKSSPRTSSQSLQIVVPPTFPGYWDPIRIAQVIENLLTNAVRYSLGQGEIELRVAQDGDFAVIAVRDEGIGLSPKEQQQVFDPFFRGDALAGKVEGSGLGLAIAKRIIEQHGGTITVESEVGEGSTFTVRLPISPFGNVLAPMPLAEEIAEYWPEGNPSGR